MRIIMVSADRKEERIMIKRVLPTNNLAFRKAFATPGNEDVLQGIIRDFFEIRPELEDITIANTYDIKAYREYLNHADGTENITSKLRETIKDVAADIKIADFVAEIQVRADSYFSERSLHYACTRFSANYNRPGAMKRLADGTFLRYSSLRPVYSLNILGYPHFPGDDGALRVFTLYDRKRDRYFDREYITIAFFELSKGQVETENQRHWMAYFKTGEAPDDAPEYIKKAAQVIDMVNLTQEERDVIDQIERAEEIYKNTIYTAQVEGERIGKLEGERIGKLEERFTVVRNALQMGIPVADISRFTGLDEGEIRKLMH